MVDGTTTADDDCTTGETGTGTGETGGSGTGEVAVALALALVVVLMPHLMALPVRRKPLSRALPSMEG